METPWYDLAECLGTDTEMWFPAPGGTPPRDAFAMCRRCPVLTECLNDALETGDVRYGIRGGMTPQARRDLLARRRREDARFRDCA